MNCITEKRRSGMRMNGGIAGILPILHSMSTVRVLFRNVCELVGRRCMGIRTANVVGGCKVGRGASVGRLHIQCDGIWRAPIRA